MPHVPHLSSVCTVTPTTPLALPSPHPSPCHAHLPNDPPAPSLPSSHATNATRRSGKEKFIDDKHETKIAFQLLSPKQPSSSSSSSSSPCCLSTLHTPTGKPPPCRPSRKKPQSVPQKAPKNEKSCRPRRAKCQSHPPPTANPHKCGQCRFGGEHNMQKIRRKSGRFSPACPPPPSNAQKRYKRGRGRGSAGVALKFPLRVVMAAVCVRCVCVGSVSVCVCV